MKKLLYFTAFLALLGCGLEDRTPRDPTMRQLVGVWDSMYGNPAVCRERLVINSDRTFWWLTEKGKFSGTLAREGGQLNFTFAEKMGELRDFRVNDQTLDVFGKNVQTRFVKIPLSLLSSKPCPENMNPSDPTPTPKPEPTVKPCPPCPPYPAPCPPCEGPREEPRPTPTPTQPAPQPQPQPQPQPCPPCEPCPPPPPPPPQPCPTCPPCPPVPVPEPTCQPCPPVIIKRGCHGYMSVPNPDPRCCK